MCFRVLHARSGFSLIELLVALTIIGLLLSLVFTAMQSARESARRTACASNLHNIGLAIIAYDAANNEFPPCFRNRGFSFHVMLLPYMEQERLYNEILENQEQGSTDSQYMYQFVPPSYHCPSDPAFPTTLI